MTQKVSLAQLIRDEVHSGMTVYLAGFSHLIPFAAGHEIIRQEITHLTLSRATPDLLYDQMIAAGCADRLIFSYAGNPGVGLLPAFRRAVESGQLIIDEFTHAEMIARLDAGAAHLPFWPLRAEPNDLSRHRGRKTVVCPYTHETIAVVPALNPDVTLVHAQRADEAGNLYVWGLRGEMKEAALAAQTLIATVEKVVPAGALRHRQENLLVPGFRVKAMAEVPFGAHPSYAQGLYERDTAFYQEWNRIAKDPESCRRWIKTWIKEVADHQAYLQRWDPEHWETLKAKGGSLDE
ncbi:MAG: 3-oxoadipate--succinyl-CoA transferase subunit A [Sulfobacillus acidophilus]|uniref:3-oxoadipate--succinyl-CoA transferase subunit A n=1 Tax=Sulfobacillus acidophilus TaxID=53633 RepID=A0A2T2WNS7_9FIRM|nr:MAG: 3-oxoadipate--succinyl-CoA transferase subunit A [Sulfobacillus acidophilus]